jgi:hypothetical protein
MRIIYMTRRLGFVYFFLGRFDFIDLFSYFYELIFEHFAIFLFLIFYFKCLQDEKKTLCKSVLSITIWYLFNRCFNFFDFILAMKIYILRISRSIQFHIISHFMFIIFNSFYYEFSYFKCPKLCMILICPQKPWVDIRKRGFPSFANSTLSHIRSCICSQRFVLRLLKY